MSYEQDRKAIPERLAKITVVRGAGTKVKGKTAVGFGLAAQVGEETAGLTSGRGLIVTDSTLVGFGTHEVAEASLTAAGLSCDVFDAVESEPSVDCARRVQEAVRSRKYDFVIGMGGGSVMDMAKTAALMATNSSDVLEYFVGKELETEAIPLLLLPTTSGTGSEVSPFIVISDGPNKRFISTPFAFATVSLVDPLLTVTMPPKVTAATGLDAISHGIEGAISMQDPYTEALAGKSIDLTFSYLPRAFADGDDLEARYYMSFASVLGMSAYAQGGGLYAHSVSYILTSSLKTPHGVGCGLSLPYTLAYNADQIPELLDRLARHVPAGSAEAGGGKADLPSALLGLLRAVETPADLKSLGVERAAKDGFVRELLEVYVRPKNPRSMDRGEAETLFDAMWYGEIDRIR